MKIALLLAFLLGMVGISAAQFDMNGMMSSPVSAMMRQDIRKELKLTKDQSKTIDGILKQFQTNGRNQDLNIMAKYDEANKQILDTLDEGQNKRLGEIRIQMRGPFAIGDADVSKPLGLTEDQVSQVKQIRSDYTSQMMQIAQHHGNSAAKELEKARDAADAKILALLTDDQRAKFKEMQGEPFKNARPKGY